jgi:RNA polymerase sigma-70 factor (ECF subfamily)
MRVYRFEDIRERENEFVRDCQKGDEAAWNELVRRHTRHIYSRCRRFTRRECEAQDLTQEVLLRVYCTLGSFRADELSFVAWLNLVTKNLLIDHYRRTRRDRATVALDAVMLASNKAAVVTEHPGSAFERTETREILLSAMEKLPEELRDTIALFDLHELSYGEIAMRLGIPIGTVKSRLHRGRGMLAHLLRRYRMAA